MKNLKFLNLALILCNFIAAKDNNNQRVNNIVVDFYRVNPKLRGVVSYVRSALGEKAASIIKDLNLSLASKKDLLAFDGQADFSPVYLGIGLKLGLNTIFDYNEANSKALEARYDKSGLPEVEKIVAEYIQSVVNWNMKNEFAHIANDYIATRRNDVKEREIREKYGDIGKEESADFMAHSADAEHSYTKLQNELCILEKSLRLYYPKYDEKVDQEIDVPILCIEDLEDMIDLSDKAEKYTSLAKKRSEYSLDRARNNLLSSYTSFVPVFTFEGEMMLSSSKDPSAHAKDKDKASVKISMDISPSKFMKTYSSHAQYEYAKYDYTWEARKYNFEYTKSISELKIAKTGFESAKLSMKAKKLALESAMLQYKSGDIVHSKVGNIRADYYHACERYYNAAEKYVSVMIEYLKLTGKLRDMFLAQLDEEIGGM